MTGEARPGIRVVLADDHPAYRERLTIEWESSAEIDCVASVGDGHQALQAISHHRPDVAVIDVTMPELTGIEVLQAMQRDHLLTPVLIVSGYTDEATAHAALKAGARGYLPKSVETEELTRAVQMIASGQPVLSSRLQGHLLDSLYAAEPKKPTLSQRESAVLQFAAAGQSNAAIGRALNLSQATVKATIHDACAKLGVSDRTAAVAKSIREGLLPLPRR